MRRFALAVGLVATAAAGQSDGGYFVVRVLVESGTGVASAGPAGGPAGMPGGGMMDPRGPLGGGAGGKPGMAGPGGMGPGMMGPMGPGGPAAAGTVTIRPGGDPARSIFVVVPYTRQPGPTKAFYPKRGDHPFFNPPWNVRAVHRNMATNLFVDEATVQLYTKFGPGLPPVNKTRESLALEKYARWQRDPADGQLLLDHLFEALECGLVGESVKMADDLLAAVKANKTRVTPPVRVFADAYGAVQKLIKDPPAKRGADGPLWAERLGAAVPGVAQHLTRGHYTLVYWDASQADLDRRLAQLEDNFRAFYLWHAARGVVLPVPEKPLVAVLPRDGDDTLRKFAAALDRTPILADGFYAPEHDLLFLSPERLDEVGRTFHRQMQQIHKEGWAWDALLVGEGPPVDTSGQNPKARRPEEVARAMTYAMVERYAAEANEWQAVSREGGRQLLYATGQLPRHVALPLWLANGSVSFWTRPRGVVMSARGDGDAEKVFATIGLTTGYGGPNYIRQKQFADLVANKQLNADPAQTLRNTVTDAYYLAAVDRVDADDPRLPLPPARKRAAVPGTLPGAAEPPPPPPDPAALERQKSEFLSAKRYATSWALYYYLAKEKPDGLRRYLAELAAMPRDLPFEESSRLDLFARAFDLTAGPGGETDPAKFKAFAAGWLVGVRNLPPAGVEFEIREPAAAPSNGTPAAGAFGPTGPGAGAGAGGSGGNTPGTSDN